MATVRTNNDNYKAIADAIREKKGIEGTFYPSEMPEIIKTLGGDDKAIIENTLTVLDRDDITTVKERTFFGSILEEVNLPNCTEIGENAFYECHQLKKITLPQVTGIPAGAFYLNVTTDGTESLEEVNLPNCTTLETEAFSTSSYQKIRQFRLNAPKINYIGAEAFQNCEILTDDRIEENISTLMGYAFKHGSIKNADGSHRSELNFKKVTSLSQSNVFCNFKAEKMLFPNVSGQIGTQCFGTCTAKVIDFGEGVTKIGGNAFSYATDLERLIFRSTSLITLSYTTAFNSSAIAKGTGYIYVPDDLVESYKTATNWKTYATQFKPLSELDTETTE